MWGDRMSKIGTFLDYEAVEFSPELNRLLLEGFDEDTTVIEMFKKMDRMWDELIFADQNITKEDIK
jgi:hypothetical protein